MNSVSPLEAFEYAESLVEAYSDDSDDVRVDFRIGGVKFYERSLDSAMADGGWNVLYHTPSVIWQQDERERYEVQSTWYQSDVSNQFMDIKI